MTDKNTLLNLYRKIFLIRKCEERICAEYDTDAMKTPVHLCIGAEAISTGVLEALPSTDHIFGTYRNHGLYLGVSEDTDGFFAEMYGKASGCAAGKAGSMHLTYPEKGLVLTSAVVATTIPVAVGAALANQYQGKDDIVAVFFGDGAVEEGAFWESVNFACLKKLKIIFVCEDNGLAIHTPVEKRQGFKSLSEIVKGFDCNTVTAAGHDVGAVYEAAVKAVNQMQQDSKPCFMYYKYFRYLQHVGVFEDFDAGYREKPTEQEMSGHDPLKHAYKAVMNAGATRDEIESIEKEILSKIDVSVQKAVQDNFPDQDEFYRGVLSE